jgi:hypothetical protein
MKNLFIILFFFLLNISLFSNNIAIKLLENSYKQLNKDLLECQVEEKRIYKQSSDLADHLALRERIEGLAKKRESLREFLDEVIVKEKYSKKDEDKENENGVSDSEDKNKPGKSSDTDKDKNPKAEKEEKTTPDKDKKIVTNDQEDKATAGNKTRIITFNKKVVKPDKPFTYTVNPPKHFLNPKIVWIKCSSNLSTLDSSPMGKSMHGVLVADPMITRAQNAYVAVLLRDVANPNLYKKASSGILISAYTQETKIGLKLSSKMISGRSYNFLIKVPADFKAPFSILVKSSSGKHLIVNSNTTSLAGSIKAWGNGDPKVILSGSVSARVYDDSGKIGYVNKLVSIDEPTQADLDKIPMEQPPEWYETAAKVAWTATKSTMKATGEMIQTVADAEAKHGFLKKIPKQPPAGSKPYIPSSKPYIPSTKYKPPPRKQPEWMTKNGNWVPYKGNPQPKKKTKKSKYRKYYIYKCVCQHIKTGKKNVYLQTRADKKVNHLIVWSGNFAKLTYTLIGEANNYEDAVKISKSNYVYIREWDPNFITFKPR